ncbi:aldolase/citrate lyase family protein [Rhodococcoides yunnanense]|uniref:aldolase/citrate lyase family protein n=1 Tax=Rhodococcoides yunnanense TaxID=278209 RepID=UPI00093406DC|nr:aldolase/citrate lyase family protein [Rhodococcus yunnanensis]
MQHDDARCSTLFLVDKAIGGESDAIIIDPEDAVPLSQKESARRDVARWLDTRRHSSTEVWVRVTPEFLAEDLAAVARTGIDGIMIAKCSVDAVARCDSRM